MLHVFFIKTEVMENCGRNPSPAKHNVPALHNVCRVAALSLRVYLLSTGIEKQMQLNGASSLRVPVRLGMRYHTHGCDYFLHHRC